MCGIIPIYNSGGNNDVVNYRPVVRLLCIPKLFDCKFSDFVAFNVKLLN